LKLNIMPLCTCSAMWQCAIHGPGLGTSNSMSMLAFYADNFGLIDLGRPVDVEYGRLRAATEGLGRPIQQRPVDRRIGDEQWPAAHHPEPPALRASPLHGLRCSDRSWQASCRP
jgi:hypothetical protein